MEKTFSFGKQLRLRSAHDFANVFNGRSGATLKLNAGRCIFLYRGNELSCPRLGVVISKKNVSLAVERNRLKRIVKESFRLRQHQLENIDCVVLIYKDADQLSNMEWKEVLEKQWIKLCKKNYL
ncbi:MAG: ribonuclease P protein component [Gammaproteobacteria bacterium GWE2_37_16]|nr:MAG: ribonuclease P protein component [Gammaproteobacteria bacterium GWE2_37_16]